MVNGIALRRIAAATIAAVAVTFTGLTAAQADVNNGTFDTSSVAPWGSWGTTAFEVVDGKLCASSSQELRWNAGVYQEGITLTAGPKQIAFTVTGEGAFKVNVETPKDQTPAALGQDFTVTGTQTFTYDFTAADTTNGKVVFEVGGDASGHTVCLDDIAITDVSTATEYITNGDFSAGKAPFSDYGHVGSVVDGAFCGTVTGPLVDPWSAGLGYNGIALPAGDYELSFDASTTGSFTALLQNASTYADIARTTVSGTDTTHYSVEFTVVDPVPAANLQFHLGPLAADANYTYCVDNVSVLGSAAPEEPEEPVLQGGVNLLDNGNFATGVDPWSPYGAGLSGSSASTGAFCTNVGANLTNPWDAGLSYNNLDLPAGDYVISFDATTTGTFQATLQTSTYAAVFPAFPVDGSKSHYELEFTVPAALTGAGLSFQFGGNTDAYSACIDNVFLGAPAVEYVTNGTFDTEKSPWSTDGVTSWSIDSGALCVEIPGGTTNAWDVNVHYDGMQLPAGPYTLKFKASGTGGPMRAIVGLGASPYTVYAEHIATPSATLEEHVVYFTMNSASNNAQIAFQVGGSSTPWTFCIDDVSLLSGGEKPPYAPETGPRVKVNQVGYLHDGPQRATLVTDATDPVAWDLVKVGDTSATASGLTTPKGDDASSNENVHVIDFAGDYPDGTYVLKADGDTSYEFTIGDDLYGDLLTDALNYFYLVRSGIAIDGDIVGEDYARPAGHMSEAGGSDVNQGDYNVACQPADESQTVYGEPWTCDYTLDVVGGWYDAGDHGKYVVNGGISAAQVMGVYERALRAGPDAVAALADGSLNLPEHGNGIPDVLDEAKWELDFMMSMTVPEGEDLAGMVHHKVHDYGWTGLPLLPSNDAKVRYLHRPSTAATLNLAADAAQGARLFESFDSDYADELLASAKTAWAAALAHPAIFAPAADGANGGGPYDDNDVSDEFYWAAAELYLTTGDAEYLEFLQNSPVATIDSFPTAGFSWDQLDAIAKIDLATVPSAFPDRLAIADQVIAGAEGLADVQSSQAFGQALPANKFVWGSSSQVVNNVVVLAAGYDLTGNGAFKDAAYESMDYIFGRNALANSYVTGYGTQYSENQHSRWFAAQLNSELPHPPKGSLAGGPNANVSTWDPTFAALYPAGNCAPQLCYVDDITSWSTNEITVNWNAALSAAASFLTAPNAAVTLPDRPFESAPKPAITGDKNVGSKLTAVVGAWEPEPTTVKYQWYRNGKAISGAKGASYKITTADSGAKITVTVTASKPGYVTTSKTSSAVTLPKYFTKTPKPTITGANWPGYKLTAHAGTWSPKPSSLKYQWYRDGKAISKATKSTYTLTKADAGSKVTVKVTAKRSGYATVTTTSAAKTIAKLYFTGWAVPKITGTLKVGHVQTAHAGKWSPKPDSFGYQWYRNGVAIKGATKSTYKLVSADRGKYISVKITAHKKGYHDLGIKGSKITKVR